MRLAVLPTLATRTSEAELIDHSSHDPSVLADNLGDIREINRWLGGGWLTLRALERLVRDLPAEGDLEVLDVGTGSADIPEAMIRWFDRRCGRMQIVATDLSTDVLRVARVRALPMSRQMVFLAADGCALPFADRSFEVATCSLVLHHLDPDVAVRLLAEMRRVSRRGVIVNDLVRSWPAYAGAWILCRLISGNPLTRHDGPLSVRRAYSTREITGLLERAEFDGIEVAGSLGYRIAVVARTPEWQVSRAI